MKLDLRTALFNFCYLPLSWLWLCALGLLGVLCSPFLSCPTLILRVVKPGLALLLSPLVKGKIKVAYDTDFDPEVVSLFCQPHVNLLDGSLAAHFIPRPFCGLMLKSHFSIPGFGILMSHTRGIPVGPEPGQLQNITLSFQERVEEGLSVLCFPEAHRTKTGAVGPLRSGVFLAAKAANMPVVPVAVEGMFAIKQKGRWWFQRGEVRVHVGPQLYWDQVKSEDEMQRRVELFMRGHVAMECLAA